MAPFSLLIDEGKIYGNSAKVFGWPNFIIHAFG